MKKILLPYAYDKMKNLVHIDNAQKGEQYICPVCGAELMIRISKIPKGEKYHKRNHFVHKGNSENTCSESFLHKSFKDKCVEFIKSKILTKSDLYFEWECHKEGCEEKHRGNLLKKAVDIIPEYDLGVCKPDIALLDKNGKVIIVIEVVVTHSPESKTMEYYDSNNIACLLYYVNDFEDCERIEEKLSSPDYVNKCPNPICKKCRGIMNRAKMVTVTTDCYNCGKEMKIAMIICNSENKILTPAKFNEQEINIAKSLGVNLEKRYSKTMHDSYMANVCKHCNAFVGEYFMDEYYYSTYDKEVDLDYKCFDCILWGNLK